MSRSSQKPLADRQLSIGSAVRRGPGKSAPTEDRTSHGHTLWEQVVRLREELAQRTETIEHIEHRFRRDIEPRELRLTDAICLQCEQLIAHYRDTDLGVAERSLLGLWITDTLQTLQQHPFADSGTVDRLGLCWQRLLTERHGNVDSQLAQAARQRLGDRGRHNAAEPPTPPWQPEGDDHAVHDRGATSPPPSDEAPDPSQPSPGSRSQEPSSDTANAVSDDATLAAMVAFLFRKLARVLHPDRDTDESGKARKHELMSACLKARDNNDLAGLLTLYHQQIGAPPESWLADNRQAMQRVLNGQVFRLRVKLMRCMPHDALHRQIVERYFSLQAGETDRRIDAHRDALEQEIGKCQRRQQELESESGLRARLDERRELELDRRVIEELTGA